MCKFFNQLIFISFFVVLGTTSALAAKCSPQQAEAEQGLRIHSELMVIGLNCQHMTPRGWKNFYAQYRDITKNQANVLASYEREMIKYYTRNGVKNPEGKLHDLRTSMANHTSTDAAKMRPDIFCAKFAPRIPQVAKMSNADFKSWAANAAQGAANRQVCRY